MKTLKQESHIDTIMKLIQEEAEITSGKDVVGKLYSVTRQIDDKIIILMEEMREEEREKNELRYLHDGTRRSQ